MINCETSCLAQEICSVKLLLAPIGDFVPIKISKLLVNSRGYSQALFVASGDIGRVGAEL